MGYKKQTYEGTPHFQCEECPFDTFDEDAMSRHQADTHPAGTQTTTSASAPTKETTASPETEGGSPKPGRSGSR
jgi:hypothetical protein